jgi:iduronate 2-sulfatase
MTYRPAITTILAALFALSFASGISKAASPEYPNVLFIAVDDLRPELGCYGVEGMRTPSIDRLARSGVVFDRHYVQFAVCIPSRVALLTSLRSERTHQKYGPPVWQKVEGARPLGKTFKAAGYTTVSLGKIWHVEGGGVGDEFDVKWSPKVGDYADPDSERIKKQRMARRNQAKREGRRYQEVPGLLPPITECADVPDSTYKDGMIGDRAVEELRRLGEDKKPFMMAVGFIKPHLPFVAPKKYWDMYEEAEMPLAANPEFPKHMPRSGGKRRTQWKIGQPREP